MPSTMDLLFQGARYRQPTSPAEAFGVMAVDTLTGGLASAGLGYVYGRYHDKWYGKRSPEILGGVGKVLEAAALLTIGPGFTQAFVGSLGQVGVNAYSMAHGLKAGQKAAGIAVVKVPTGTDVKKLKAGDAVPASTAVGALPPAEAGHGLAWDHIQELASMH